MSETVQKVVPSKIPVTADIDRETHRLLGEMAADEQRSMRRQIAVILSERVREWSERRASAVRDEVQQEGTPSAA